MKTAVLFSYILIIGLGVVVFMQWRMITNYMMPGNNKTPPANREVSAGEWTKKLSDSLKEMNVDLKFE